MKAFFPRQVIPCGWFYQTHGLWLPWELHSYVDTAQISPSWVNRAKKTPNLYTALPRDLFIQFEPSPFVQYLNNPHLLKLKTLSLLSCMLWFHSITNTKVTKESELRCITWNIELQYPQGNSDLVSHFYGILYLAFISKVGLSSQVSTWKSR